MDVMRFKVLDPAGAISFVGPCHGLKVLTAACAKNPTTLAELLEYTRAYDAQLSEYLLNGLAVFDEHNTAESNGAIRGTLETAAPEKTPPFRVLNTITEGASTEPVGAGLVIFNLPARRIIQVQNAYASVERQDQGRIRENGMPTRRLYRYALPQEWRLLP
ncbi:MAG: hypothetical protein H0V86_01715 [Chloroflexia bacterium]|nr:hypothetical protein [Chloroflexia bacterium]